MEMSAGAVRCSAMLFSSICATTGSTSSRCERRTSTRLGATPAAPALQKVVRQADGEPPDRQAAADLAGSRALPAEKKVPECALQPPRVCPPNVRISVSLLCRGRAARSPPAPEPHAEARRRGTARWSDWTWAARRPTAPQTKASTRASAPTLQRTTPLRANRPDLYDGSIVDQIIRPRLQMPTPINRSP